LAQLLEDGQAQLVAAHGLAIDQAGADTCYQDLRGQPMSAIPNKVIPAKHRH
jgi:hypothetical protein